MYSRKRKTDGLAPSTIAREATQSLADCYQRLSDGFEKQAVDTNEMGSKKCCWLLADRYANSKRLVDMALELLAEADRSANGIQTPAEEEPGRITCAAILHADGSVEHING